MIDKIHSFVGTADGLIIYLISLFAVTMMVDFLTGTFSALVNPDIDFNSKSGINGLLRKLALLMGVIVGQAIIIPFWAYGQMGRWVTVIFIGGFELFEFKSIMENLIKMGIDVTPFKWLVDTVEKLLNEYMNKSGKGGGK